MKTFLLCYEANNSNGGRIVGDSTIHAHALTAAAIERIRGVIADEVNQGGKIGYQVNFRSVTELDQPEDA